ncbi:MAG: PAS domain-containing protein, partial [Candidatus Nomurabacteria bacterium]|nr:PAS domain-containing protein [Candidatus Nomurabacteria bacterium]
MTGGNTDAVLYNQKALNIIYKACTMLGLVAFVYNVMSYFDLVNRPSAYVGWASVTIGIVFLISGIAAPIIKPSTKVQIILLCVGYYLMWSLNVLFSIGNSTVSYVFGLMVLIATDILQGPKVMLAGCLYLPILMFSALAMGGNASNTHALTGMATASVLTICTACLIAWLNSTNLIRISAYEQLKSRERMQRDRLATVINNISDAIISVTRHGVVRLYNSATLSLLDTNATLNGKRIDNVLNLEDADGNQVKISDIINPRRIIERDDLLYVFEDGQKINLYLSCSPVRSSYGNDGQPDNGGAIVILRDITKVKSLDEER